MIARKRSTWCAVGVLLGVLGVNAHAGDGAALNAVLEQVTKALGDVRGFVADVECDEPRTVLF